MPVEKHFVSDGVFFFLNVFSLCDSLGYEEMNII